MIEISRIIEAYAAVARPIILNFFVPNSCIASSRITVEVLSRFGVSAEAIATKFVVLLPEKKLAYVSGLDPQERADAKKKSQTWIDLLPDGDDSMNVHVIVLAGDRWFLDASFDQVRGPLKITLEPKVFVIPLDGQTIEDKYSVDMDLKCALDDGTPIEIRYVTHCGDAFKRTPAWETDHLRVPIHLICTAMKAALDERRKPTKEGHQRWQM